MSMPYQAEEVMRTKKRIKYGIVNWFNTKFSDQTLLEIYGRLKRELPSNS